MTKQPQFEQYEPPAVVYEAALEVRAGTPVPGIPFDVVE